MEITAEEMAEFQEFKARKAKKEAELKAKEQRKEYAGLVDALIEDAIPRLQEASNNLSRIKAQISDSFTTALNIKSDVLGLGKNDQLSHTFTHSNGTMRVMLGTYTNDGYSDMVNDGIKMVKDYIESLVDDDKSRMLVSAVLKLLSKDSKGTLKASRVIQLRKMADESGDDKFMEGVRIIEESYMPVVSKQFLRADVKDEKGAWKSIPLSMTEA